MSCGIYCITNTINNKKYIGQSRNIEKRWQGHICELKKNKHGNSHLQNAWTSYGSTSFTFAIIEICTKDELTERENHWMTMHNTLDRKLGYNLREAGDTSGVCNEGERNNGAKITESQAISIIELLLAGKSVYSIEKELGIHNRTIRHIKKKENWKHLTEGLEFPSTESSKYKGVSYDKRYRKYAANLFIDKQRVYLEYFDTEIEAAIARDVKSKEYLGDKARLNFPE